MAFVLAAVAAPRTARPEASSEGMVLIPGGTYSPFFKTKRAKSFPASTVGDKVRIRTFWMDRRPVTNEQFLAFVTAHPEWRKSVVKPIFADPRYLDGWESDLSWGDARKARQPVINVSWFAAEAYCEAENKVLPSTDQWEYALADRGRNQKAVRERILAWYAIPNRAELPVVDSASANGYGVAGLVGLVWEWTGDFASAMAGPELRSSGDRNKELFCGGASLGAKDASDYAAFMRYSFRSSLKATYTTQNLGFRCARAAS